MRDSLIGYLLGALDDHEAARLEARLRHDPRLQAQLRTAARSLRPLKLDYDDLDPPPGLAHRTCCFVQAASRNAGNHRYERGMTSSTWRMVDFTVAAAIFLAACLLFFPAINNSRYHAQIAGCQNNLYQLGRALIAYSENARGLFPQVPANGNLAFAGMYAPTLRDLGLVTDASLFRCPSSSNTESESEFPLPTRAAIERASGQQLAVLQRWAGGDYGYTLGYLSGAGQLRGIPNRHRAYFALMADAPIKNRNGQSPGVAHRNVLFESGHVRQIAVDADAWGRDQLFLNDLHEVAPGLHVGDTVIGASSTAPILPTLLRNRAP